MRKRVLAGLLAAVTILLAGCSSGHDATVYQGDFTFVSPGGKSEFTYPAADRKAIGTISGPDLTGQNTLSTANYKGKVVVLNFWGSWCAPCRAEAPDLEAAWTKLQPKGVQFLGLNLKDDEGAGAAFNKSKGITYPSIYDPTMRTLLSIRGYPTGGIPSTVVLDRQGRVAAIALRQLTTEQQVLDLVTPVADEK